METVFFYPKYCIIRKFELRFQTNEPILFPKPVAPVHTGEILPDNSLFLCPSEGINRLETTITLTKGEKK
jgi:hypothetical protein